MQSLFRTFMAVAVLGVLLLSTSQTHGFGRRAADCGPPQNVVLQVCDPCTNCKYDVPVCIPCCCKGAPSVCYQRTLIGHGKVTFEWCCGYRVTVRFPHCGGYRVVQARF